MALSKTKCDKELGKLVHNHLVAKGVETPMTPNNLSEQEKRDIIESRFADIMTALGLDLTDDSLEETPKRAAIVVDTNMIKSGLSDFYTSKHSNQVS